MLTEISSGAVCIRDNARLPEGLQCNGEPLFPGWQLVREMNITELDAAVRNAGWHLFSLAGEVTGEALARSRDRALRKAIRDVVTQFDPRVNALEVVSASVRSFLGLHYAKVRAQARHIQPGVFLFHEEPSVWPKPKAAGAAAMQTAA